MRIQALILVFPFAVFLTETASFVPALQDACTIVSAEESSCCMKIENTEEEECGSKTENDKNTSGNDCTDNTDCTTCPVCYTFIFQPQYEWPAEQFLFTKNYGSLSTSYTSFYIPDVWKPPNGFFYYA
jgi:hypothetical protein